MSGGLRFNSGKPEPIKTLENLFNNYSTNEFTNYVLSERYKYRDNNNLADTANYPIDESYLADFDVLIDITRLCHFGAEVKGYGRANWKLGMKWSTVVNSLLRHLIRFWIYKEDYDPETGIRHTTAIAWNAMALGTYMYKNIGEDDR
jgi:hypothetical protein